MLRIRCLILKNDPRISPRIDFIIALAAGTVRTDPLRIYLGVDDFDIQPLSRVESRRQTHRGVEHMSGVPAK